MFDPKLSSEAAPVRLVGAATERGPIAPSTPVNTLTRASKDQVSQAQSGIRKLDDDRPVPKVDVFGAIASIAGSVGQGLGALGVGQGSNLTQADRDNAALQPFAQELTKLQGARTQGKAGITAKISLAASSFIANNPRLQGQALDLVKNLTGVETIVQESLNLEDINRENKSKWLQNTPQGRLVAARAANIPANERLVMIDQEYNRSQVQASVVEQASIRLDAAKADQELYNIESATQAQSIAQEQSRQIQDLITNELLPETTNPNEIFDLQEELSGLRQLRELKAAEFLTEYPGVKVEDVEKSIAEVMAPIDRMIGMLESGGKDIQKLAQTQGAQAVLELGKMLQEEGLGPVFQTPDGIRSITEALIFNDGLLDIERVSKAYKDRYSAAPDGAIVNIPESNSPTPSQTLAPRAQKFYADNPPARRDLIQISSNVMNGPELDTPENIKTSFDAGMELIGAISAKEDVLDDQSFGQFVDNNLKRFTELAKLPGEQGETFSRALNGMLVKQMAINTFRTKEVLNQLPSGFVLSYDDKFKLEFNIEAFNRAEDTLTTQVKTVLKQNNLPVIEENIRAVLADPIAFIKEASGLNNRKFAGKVSTFNLANKSFNRVESRVGRLNKIDFSAKAIDTIENWADETTAATLRSEEDFFSSDVTKASVVTAKDKKLAEENNASLPLFNSDLEVQEAITNGDIKIGDRVKVGDKVYDVEEDDGDS